MIHYRLYFLDSDGHIRHAIDLQCSSDAEAVQSVEQHRDGRDMELWQGGRRVKVIPKLES